MFARNSGESGCRRHFLSSGARSDGVKPLVAAANVKTF